MLSPFLLVNIFRIVLIMFCYQRLRFSVSNSSTLRTIWTLLIVGYALTNIRSFAPASLQNLHYYYDLSWLLVINLFRSGLRSLLLKLIRFHLSTRSLGVRHSSLAFHRLLVYRLGFTVVFWTLTCLAVLSTIWPDQVSVRRLGKLASHFLHP